MVPDARKHYALPNSSIRQIADFALVLLIFLVKTQVAGKHFALPNSSIRQIAAVTPQPMRWLGTIACNLIHELKKILVLTIVGNQWYR